MRKIVVQEFMSVDGVMQAPGGPEEDPSEGFPYGGWQRDSEYEEGQFQKLADGINNAEGFLLGRKTYDIFAAYWPQQSDSFAEPLNERPKWVVSTTLPEPLSWHNATLIKTDVVQALRDLKSGGDGQITVIGSGGLVQTLLANDLADELSIFVSTLALSTGKRLFREGLPWINLELLDSITSEQYGSQWFLYKPTVKA